LGINRRATSDEQVRAKDAQLGLDQSLVVTTPERLPIAGESLPSE
jgi:hypothetical protein